MLIADWWTNLAHLVRLQLFALLEPQNPSVVQETGTNFATGICVITFLDPPVTLLS
jgi:hypothetical protein